MFWQKVTINLILGGKQVNHNLRSQTRKTYRKVAVFSPF